MEHIALDKFDNVYVTDPKKGNIVTIIQDSFVESECSDFMKL
jgi:hypothetical protein